MLALVFALFVLLVPLLGCSPSLADSAPSFDRAADSVAPASPQEIAAGVVRPPYFRVRADTGTTMLVLGTIHLGPTEGWRFSRAVLEGLVAADAFVLEIDLRDATEDEVSSVLAERVVLPTSVLLDDVVSPETAKLLAENEAVLAELGFPAAARKRFKPWFVAVALVESANSLSGFEAGRSAERTILAAAGERPIAGLETFEAQLAMLDELSPRLQDAMLRDTVSRLDESAAQFGELVRAWASNDARALTEIAHQGIDELPELGDFYEIFLADRNRRWVAQLASLLEDPARAGETVFVGVGALHLVGAGSVIELLEARGFDVEAIRQDDAAASAAGGVP